MDSDASPPRGRLKRALITSFKIGVYATVVAIIALVVAVAVAMNELPSYDKLVRRDDLGQMIRVHAADNSVVVSLGPSFGNWLSNDQIPASMKNAMIAIEDKRFRSHPGVDPIGIMRAVTVRVQRGRWVQGGSTITQQLARNIFLTNTKTFGRKFREWVLALALERRFTKDQILELYLNRVYFGGGAYGIDAASRTFFGHSANTLSLSESAIIAGLVKAPSNYAPTADQQAARQRSRIVIQAMREGGYITAAEAAAAGPEAAQMAPAAKQNQNSIRYFTDWVLPQLDTLIDEREKPIDVWTTIDPEMQRAGDAAINANAPAGAQGALIALDRDGAVRAMVGGRDYVSSIYNRATQAVRQPGSSFKLFVYLSALEAGYKPDDLVADAPITINGWTPRNNSRHYSGNVTVRQAFAQSLNSVSVRLAQEVGFSTVKSMAERFGITTPIVTHPSMALGSSDVRLLDLTRAYASVARKGIAAMPYGIVRVTTTDGAILYQHDAAESRVLVAPWVAAQMTDLMQASVMTGTGRAAQIGRPVAGKTGTTTANKDGWFVGFSSGITAGIWMGRDDAKVVPGLQGGTAPARAFHDFMIRAVAKRPPEAFEISVPQPTWASEPDEETWFEAPDNGVVLAPDGAAPPPPADAPPVADGRRPPADEPDAADDDRLNQDWLDRAIRRDPPPAPRDPNASRRFPPPIDRRRQRSPAPDPVEREPVTPQP